MTQAEQRKFWNQWSRFQQQKEKKYVPKFNNALKIQVKTFLKTNDVNAIPSFPIYEVLTKLYEEVGVEWAKKTRQFIVKADGLMGFNQRILELMNQYLGIDLLNYAEWMTQYSREVISQFLVFGANNQLSPLEIADLLSHHSEFGYMRALRIARTETVTAANSAAQLFAMTSDVETVKQWIAVKDKRTRHDHKLVDGNIVGVDEYFTVGGAQMMHPGARTQPNGLPVPAQEIVNCRCTMAFVAKRDENNRIMMRNQ